MKTKLKYKINLRPICRFISLEENLLAGFCDAKEML
jgi:hypothetical protein